MRCFAVTEQNVFFFNSEDELYLTVNSLNRTNSDILLSHLERVDIENWSNLISVQFFCCCCCCFNY